MNYDFYNDSGVISKYAMNDKIDLFNPFEAYLKGNAFKNEYIPYKDYKVSKIGINSEEEEMLVGIGENAFMMHDLNLYLDVHPNNREALNMFNEYRNKANDLIMKYERKYGPLMVKATDNNVFNWVTKWPWVN